jgi:hypothetical protein
MIAGCLGGLGRLQELFGPLVDLRLGVRVVGEPALDADAMDADDAEDPAAVGQFLGAHDASQRADVGADVAPAHLGSPLYEHDAERAVVMRPGVAHHAPVAELEHVERQHHPRHEHGAQGKHRGHRRCFPLLAFGRAARASLAHCPPGLSLRAPPA